MNDPILEMRGVSKSFFGIKALRAVDLTVHAREIHALMGENGAGKSTLMKILSGAYRPDPAGEIRIEGKPVRIEGPLGGRAAGISIIYQELSLAPNLSVAENIYLGRELLAVWLAGPRQHARGRRPHSRQVGCGLHAVDPSRSSVHGPAATRRDRACAAREFKNPDHGRADHRAVGRRERAAVRADPPAPRRGSRHHLHLASHGRGRTRSATASPCCATAAGRLARQAGDPRRHHRPDDGRARCLIVLQEGA